MFKAVETEDWRRRYLDSLRDMERDERQFRDQQQTLYKLLGRLCLAAQGQSPRLDQELKRLKESVRREVAPAELEPLGQAIADAVLEIDQAGVKPAKAEKAEKAGKAEETATTGKVVIKLAESSTQSIATPTITEKVFEVLGEDRIRGQLSRLLSELRQETKLVPEVEVINRELAVALTPQQLPDVIERVGALVMQRMQGLERMRQELEQLLSQLASQLESLTRYVEGSAREETQRNTSSETLNLQITGEMQALGDTVDAGTDLAVIRRQLRQRLDSIGQHLLDYRDREEARARQTRARTEQMRGRMDEMESEARKLKARLTDERRMSMRDPLTQIPNRLAYEQRVAEELDRWTRFSQPTCIAVWDIDEFKAINDSYGHRAGDKVLSVVAECLANSIRSTDFIARYGGEEFVMLLPGTTLPDAILLAEEMREAVTHLGFHFRGKPVSITIS